MRLHFVKADPNAKVYDTIVAKMADFNYGFVFKHNDGFNERGIVIVLPHGVVEVIHTSGLTFVTVHAHVSDVMMVIQMLKDNGVDLKELGFSAEVMK